MDYINEDDTIDYINEDDTIDYINEDDILKLIKNGYEPFVENDGMYDYNYGLRKCEKKEINNITHIIYDTVWINREQLIDMEDRGLFKIINF